MGGSTYRRQGVAAHRPDAPAAVSCTGCVVQRRDRRASLRRGSTADRWRTRCMQSQRTLTLLQATPSALDAGTGPAGAERSRNRSTAQGHLARHSCDGPYDRAMLLAVDIGNTNVTTGLFRNGSLVATRRATTHARATADELEHLLDALLHLDDATFADVSAISSCSVVPALSAALETVATRRERTILVAAAGNVPLAIRVDRPAEVGADRLVNSLAAARIHGAPAIVVDFGTATTLDCVAADGAYVGGAIAPRAGAGPRGARGADRQAAPDRAASAGPRNRAGHGQCDAVRHRVRLPGASERPDRPRPTRARRPGRDRDVRRSRRS